MNISSLQLSELAEHHDLRCGLGLVQYKDVKTEFKTSHKQAVLLGDILSLEYGNGLTDEERSGSGYPVVGSNGIVGYHYDYLIEGPAIIVGRKGSAGEVTYIPTGCYPIDTTFYVNLKSDMYDLKFLYYVLRMLKLQRLALFKGVPGLNRYDVYEVFIPVISKQEQEEIIKEISPIEDQVQELKALAVDPTLPINEVFAREFGINIDQLNQLNRESIFHRTMRDISRDGLFRFSTHYQKNVFLEDLFKDSRTWHDITSLFHISGGKRVPKEQSFASEETPYRYLRPNEVNFNSINVDEVPFLSERTYEQLRRYKISTGEFAISIVGTLGKVAYIDLDCLDIEEDRLVLSENFAKLSPNAQINNKFYYYFFHSLIFQNQIQKEYTIRTQMKLGLDKIKRFKIPVVDENLENRFVDEINVEVKKHEELLKKITHKEKEIESIIRSALLK